MKTIIKYAGFVLFILFAIWGTVSFCDIFEGLHNWLRDLFEFTACLFALIGISAISNINWFYDENANFFSEILFAPIFIFLLILTGGLFRVEYRVIFNPYLKALLIIFRILIPILLFKLVTYQK